MIFWKPNGTLDVSTDPSDLPAEQAGKNTISFAMRQCRNLDLSNLGYVKTRKGSTKLDSDAIDGTTEHIIEVDGDRYVFTDTGAIYRNEVIITKAKCAAPVFSPGGGSYAATQVVSMTTTTRSAAIYYTTDGTEPTSQSTLYSSPVNIDPFTRVQAVTIRSGFENSDITSEYYSSSAGNLFTETDGDTIITETNSDNVINEGV